MTWEPFEIVGRAGLDRARAKKLTDVMHGEPATRVRLAAQLVTEDDAAGLDAITWRLEHETSQAQIVKTIEAVEAICVERARTLARLPRVAKALRRTGYRLREPVRRPGTPADLRRAFTLAAGVASEDRRRAVEMLGAWAGCRAARRRLERLVETDRDGAVVAAAVRALADVSEARVVRVVRRHAGAAATARRDLILRGVAGIKRRQLVRVLERLGDDRGRVMPGIVRVDADAALAACESLLLDEPERCRDAVRLTESLAAHLPAATGDMPRDHPVRRRRRAAFAMLRRAVVGRARGNPEAIRALERLRWGPLLGWCRQIVQQPTTPTDARAEACRIIGERGRRHDLAGLKALVDEQDPTLCRAAVDASIALAPDRANDLLARMLTDDDAPIAQEGLRRLTARMGPRAAVGLLLDRLPQVSDETTAAQVFEHVLSAAPARLDDLLGAAIAAGSQALIRRALVLLHKRTPEEAPAIVGAVMWRHLDPGGDEPVATDCRRRRPRRRRPGPPPWHPNVDFGMSTPPVRAGGVLWALRHLRSRPAYLGPVVLPIAERLLAQSESTVHSAVVDLLQPIDDPRTTPLLVTAARRSDDRARCRAVEALAGRDDVTAYGAIVAATDDPEPIVARVARDALESHPCPPSVAEAWSDDGTRRPVWRQMLAAIDRCDTWARETGRVLVGADPTITRCHDGLGRTSPPRPGGEIEIEVSAWPIVVAHPHGEQIVRGIALHELGHHHADFRAPKMRRVSRAAARDGLRDVLNLVLDERLERRLRSLRPEWGILFDRLASYAFAQNSAVLPLPEYAELLGVPEERARIRLETGDWPGRLVDSVDAAAVPDVLLRDIDLFRTPGVLSPLAAFATCLRCGLDPAEHPDPRVARAMNIVPPDLRGLDHDAILDLCRRIVGVLGGLDACRRAARRMRELMRRHRAVRRLLDSFFGRLADAARDAPGESLFAPAPRRPEKLDPSAAAQLAWLHERRHMEVRRRMAIPAAAANVGQRLTFDPLSVTRAVRLDPDRHAAVVARIRPEIRRLRFHLERLGRSAVDEHSARRGRRLDLARARIAPLRPDPAILIHRREELLADAYIGILIDRSGSMRGPKIETARAFGVLLAEAARGIRGLEGHVSAFTDKVFYELGDLQRCAAASLEADGGNNDAGGLARAAALARASRKRHRVLFMISDGLPTECTAPALEALVDDLSGREGILCAHVVIGGEPMTRFPHHLDLSRCRPDEAVDRFGRLLVELTRPWRQARGARRTAEGARR